MHPFFCGHTALPVLGLALLAVECAHRNMNVFLPLPNPLKSQASPSQTGAPCLSQRWCWQFIRAAL
jgi:hypothetical protein